MIPLRANMCIRPSKPVLCAPRGFFWNPRGWYVHIAIWIGLCCVGCENSNPKSTERATSIPSVVLKSNGRAGYTMGDSNTVSLVVPVSFRDSDAVVFVTLERSGLRPDTSFTVPMPPNGEDVRENTFFLPLSVERCYIQTWCSWHHDPNLEAYVSLADNRNHIQLGDLLKLNSADTLERLVQRGSITQTMAALRLLELVTNDTLLDEALVGRLQQSIQTVHHAYERDGVTSKCCG